MKEDRTGFLLGLGLIAAAGLAIYMVSKNREVAHDIENKDKSKKFAGSKKIRTTERASIAHLSKRRKSKKKKTKLVQEKLRKSDAMLKKLKPGVEYTQIEIQKLTKIPYRSVRRYVNELIDQNKLIAKGYGKGKRFSRN